MTDFDVNENEVEKHQDLNMLDEKREAAHPHKAAYKTRIENYHNWHVQVKNFKVGEWELRKNESGHAQPQGEISVT